MKRKTEAVVVRSPAYVLVDHVWQHVQEATSRSWLRLNSAMHSAVMLAVEGGLRFDEQDFSEIYRRMSGGRWFGVSGNSGLGEGFYSRAVEYRNTSACQSFEHWKRRPPFVYGGARLSIGDSIAWPGLCRAKVTSFCPSGDAIIVCGYEIVDGENKLTNRLRLTIEEIRAAERGRVETNRTAREVAELRETLARWRGIDLPTAAIREMPRAARREVMRWARGPRDAPLPLPLRPLFQQHLEQAAEALSHAGRALGAASEGLATAGD